MNKYEYLDRIVFSIEYKDIKSITLNMKAIIEKGKVELK